MVKNIYYAKGAMSTGAMVDMAQLSRCFDHECSRKKWQYSRQAYVKFSLNFVWTYYVIRTIRFTCSQIEYKMLSVTSTVQSMLKCAKNVGQSVTLTAQVNNSFSIVTTAKCDWPTDTWKKLIQKFCPSTITREMVKMWDIWRSSNTKYHNFRDILKLCGNKTREYF